MGLHSIKPRKEQTMAVGIIISTLVCCIITLLSSALAAWLISNEKLQESSFGLATSIIHFISALVGTFCVNMIIKKNMIPISLLLCGCYLAVLFSCTALFWDGQYSGIGRTLIAVMLGSSCSIFALLGVKKINKKPFHKRVYR